MIVYEVNLTVQRRIEAEYRAWFDAHVREMVALPGFIGATVYERREPAPGADEFALCVQYRLVDAEALATYLAEHAPRLRADGIGRFGDAFRAERRILAPGTEY